MVGGSVRLLGYAPAVGLAACLLIVAGPACAGNERVVYSFKGGSDGSDPNDGLIDVGGTLYGTTRGGGSANCFAGCGTVFSLTQAGVEKVLYSFQGGTDGSNPIGGLINFGGVFYGTTYQGGGSANCNSGCGTVFSITPAGVETVLYSFRGGSDGASPLAALLNVGGTFYSTTEGGGLANCTNGCGTVFAVTPAGAESVVYAFKGGSDGSVPLAGLTDVGGTLYGTTGSGGANSGGTVFQVTTAGAETIVYSFTGSGGASPFAGLLNVGGTLYGTTYFGGSSSGCSAAGCGTVFAVTPAGMETVVHAFTGGNDGQYPEAGLVEIGGTLYGTTQEGGGGRRLGGGTVFSVTPAGTEKVLHAFKRFGDAGIPVAGLINVNGTLYGTSSAGGSSDNGTVFKVKP